MRITVRLFAVLRDAAGVGELPLDVADGATVASAREVLGARVVALRPYLSRAACAVNQTYSDVNTVLKDGDELALIPPVSGGSTDDWIELMPGDIIPADAIAFVSDGRAGGIDVFLGTTRAETSASGQQLVALDYEAYAEMALKQLNALVDGARERWPIAKVALLHRTGRVGVGEPSVVIAVSTPHRADAFDACRWLIDSLKRDTAIWKKEIWEDGKESWVKGNG